MKIICHANPSKKEGLRIGPILPNTFYQRARRVLQWVLQNEAGFRKVTGAQIREHLRDLDSFWPIALRDHFYTCVSGKGTKRSLEDHETDQSESEESLLEPSSGDDAASVYDSLLSISKGVQSRSKGSNAYIDQIMHAYIFGTASAGRLYLGGLPSQYERMLDCLPYVDDITELEIGETYGNHVLYEAALPGWPIAICTMSTLKTLELSRTKLETLPEDVGNLVKLVELRVLDNPFLARLANTLHKLVHLKSLTLDRNAFVIFPESVCQIPNLEYLRLKYNAIEEVPELIGNLTNLRYLALQGNRLRDLPDSIGKLLNLWLKIHDNPLVDLPETVAKLENWDLEEVELVYGFIQTSSLPTASRNVTMATTSTK